MKLAVSALISVVCWSCQLAAASSYVYTIEHHIHGSAHAVPKVEDRKHNSKLSPEIARQVLAQRIGVEDYHTPDLDDDKVLDAINTHGSREGLFGQQKGTDVLILVEAVDEEFSFLTDSPRFAISPSPSASATRGLFLDLARQALPLHLNNIPDEEVYALLKGEAVQRSERSAHHIAIWSEHELQTYMEDTLPRLKETAASISIITATSSQKGEKGADYGSYAMPAGAQSPLRKRQQSVQEEPLEVEPTTAPVTHSSVPVSSLAEQSDPLPGILPACFTSLSSCESTTRNCSGHGSCSKKYSDQNSPNDSRFKDCYACQCTTTTSDSGSGGVSTTYWGGPACQKKDVSVQFWLIALFSVFMVGLISFAVGQVWSMGEEELPSVIGAGVSGPVKRS